MDKPEGNIKCFLCFVFVKGSEKSTHSLLTAMLNLFIFLKPWCLRAGLSNYAELYFQRKNYLELNKQGSNMMFIEPLVNFLKFYVALHLIDSYFHLSERKDNQANCSAGCKIAALLLSSLEQEIISPSLVCVLKMKYELCSMICCGWRLMKPFRGTVKSPSAFK